ncbi:MBL fold metallo-hydrolase [Paracoccus sulfuroxidans]|uniref:Glyoxylase-like metal-dependent hydrolase (Beta-lactamase superfamily II) n=1 Tax=Paracoccus sulfuroxidans TaxID=384678 RepID=A0A562NME2_9RHOB|nr:MBL fold metallo-hydrolase [Paracoccus sulfuroxidans]TWI33354.1 glyoxylase-like metal-dependent hydrolase (beta-lactamase superfamily II) [Paracoccus sulfuroxidans]
MQDLDISRRAAMTLGVAACAAPVLAGRVEAQAAEAESPAEPGPRVHRISLGGFEVVTLLGGASMSQNPIETFGLGANPEEFNALSKANFIPADRSGASFALTLVKTPEALVLFDTGMMPEINAAALAAAGHAPEEVTHVVLTHMHPDHISGLISGGKPNFPKALLVAGRLENEYWAANPSDAYSANVLPLIAKARLIEDGDEVLPGIRAEAAFGHTPGHMVFLLESEGEKLLISGDSFNHYVYTVQRPGWHVRFDVDKDMGVENRKRLLARLATEGIPLISYHFPFPALGYIGGDAEAGYRFFPATYQFGW